MSDTQEWVDGLRAIADLFEENPELIPNYSGETINLFPYSVDELLSIAGALGGKWDKDAAGSWYILRRSFGPHSIEINANRDQVCERVEVGEETVEVADPEAPKVIVTRPIYEWKCPESLNALVS